MRKDPTEFRERFLRWKNGELVYENGLTLPTYEDGLTPHKKSEVNTNLATYNPEEDLYTGRYTLPEVTVTGDKSKRVYHSHAPRTSGMSKNQYKLLTGDLLGAMITGMNVLSPSLWWGAVRDANGLQDGFNRLMRGNSGFVTENFEREHPYISLGANLIGDAAILGGPSGVKNLNQSINKSNLYRAYKVSNAINAGVKENPVITAYNRNPITKEIGSVYDYRLYLDDTFPNSKIKDVLWHGSKKEGLEEFSTKYIGSHAPIKSSTGMYLAPDKYTAKSYGRKGGVYPVLLNTENPYITDQLFAIKHNGVNVANISPKTRNTILRNNDAVVATKRGEIAFFEPDNALILGSNKDLNGFKSYVLKSKNISSPTIRTKVGDVEIDNPNINYRVGTKEIVDDFNNTGIVRAGETNALTSHGKAGRFLLKKETFTNPMFKEGSLWYQPSEEMSGLLTTAEPMRVATKSSAPAANDGVFTIQGKTFVNDFNGRRIPLEGLVLDKSNTTSYIWKPEYGYRKVLQLPSTINFNDAKFYDSTAGDKSPLNFLFLSDIDRLRKSGIGGLTENAPSQESFKLFFGLYPAEYKSHWYSKLNGMPDSYKEKFVERLLNFDLDRAQETLYDIRRANNPAAYSWNSRVLLDGYDMLRNLYTSKAYKSRWTPSDADAVSSEFIQNMREINPVLLKRVIVDNDGGVPMKVHAGGLYEPNKKSIQVLDNGDLTIHTTTHEFSHASDKGKTVDLTGYVKMKPKKSLTQKQFDYYNQDTEKRARIMSLLADMHNRGYNINSYNDIQDYLFFNKAFGNHNANSIFSNYDIKMTDLLDVMRNAKSIVIPTIGVGTVYGTSNK